MEMINDSTNSVFTEGEKILIRTVTHYQVGRVEAVRGGFLFLKDAAWVADTGRFSNALKTGEFDEVEPEPNGNIVRVNIASIVDVWTFVGELPLALK